MEKLLAPTALALMISFSGCAAKIAAPAKLFPGGGVPLQANAAPDPAAAGCIYERNYGNPNFGQVYTLKNGMRLYICGMQSGIGFHGHLYHSQDGQAVAEESQISLGEVYPESSDLFSVEYVKIEPNENGLVITDLIPFNEHEFLPSIRRVVRCDGRTCKEEKSPSCAWKRPKGKINKDAFLRLRSDWTANIDQEATERTAEILAEKKKTNSALKKMTKDQEDPALDTYRNSLLGHKPSLALLLDKKINTRLNDRYKDSYGELGGYLHNKLHRTLTQLRARGCL